MGIGMVFDGATMLLGRGSGAVRNQVNNRKASIDYQTLKKGIRELRKNEFGASKNKNVARGCGVVMRRKETFYA